MKKKLLYLAICTACAIALCALISCQSTGKKKEEPFTVHKDSLQYQIGEIEMQIDPPILKLGKIRKQAVVVLYAPYEDAVILRYRYEFTNYQQCWDREGRQVFIDALKKYNEDYDERALESKNKKTLKKYGTVQGFLVWQQFKYTLRASGNMKMFIGYSFKEKAPYFSVNQKSAEYIDKVSRDNNRTSLETTHYFTRAQAAELAALFDPEFIDGLSFTGSSSRFNVYVEQDDY